MSYSAEAADQVVKMSLNGVEVAAKLSGAAAKEIAVLLYAVLNDQKKTKGKTRLTGMLKSGKELKVFAVKDGDLKRFCQAAKKYGVLYCVLKDRDATDGITDVMIRAEDASKINRIFERFGLTTVDLASVRSQIMQNREQESSGDPDPALTEPPSPVDAFLDELLRPQQPTPSREEVQAQNPIIARTAESRPSGRSSLNSARVRSDPTELRPSVRQQLREIRAAQNQEGSGGQRTSNSPAKKPKAHNHKNHTKKHNKRKGRNRE